MCLSSDYSLKLPIYIFLYINSLKVSGISLPFQSIVHKSYFYTFMLVISRILAWIMILLVNYLSLKMRYYVTNYPTLVYVIVSVCMEKLFYLGFLPFWTVSTGHYKIHSRWVFLSVVEGLMFSIKHILAWIIVLLVNYLFWDEILCYKLSNIGLCNS